MRTLQDAIDTWVDGQLERAPDPTDARLRRLSVLLFGIEP